MALKGILVQLQPIDLDELSDTYIALNPSRAVPALLIRQDGGDVVLTQSMAIMEYIEEVWPDRGFGRVLPMDPIQRAAVRAVILLPHGISRN